MSEAAAANNEPENQSPQSGVEGPQAEEESQSLEGATVADIINELHRSAYSHAETAVEDAIKCGGFLLQQKETMKHGEWKQWVEANCDFAYSTAARYMKAAVQKSTGVDFSTLAQLYAPDRSGDPDHQDAKDKKRDTLPPRTQTEHDIIELNTGLEKLQLPLCSPESFIDQAGTDFFTEKASENLDWIIRLYDLLDNLTEAQD